MEKELKKQFSEFEPIHLFRISLIPIYNDSVHDDDDEKNEAKLGLVLPLVPFIAPVAEDDADDVDEWVVDVVPLSKSFNVIRGTITRRGDVIDRFGSILMLDKRDFGVGVEEVATELVNREDKLDELVDEFELDELDNFFWDV